MDMVATDKGNLGLKVFFIWRSLCSCCFVNAYFLIPDTEGLSLEQVDRMLEETTPRTSAGWTPKTTFAAEMGRDEKGELNPEVVQDVERRDWRCKEPWLLAYLCVRIIVWRNQAGSKQ